MLGPQDYDEMDHHEKMKKNVYSIQSTSNPPDLSSPEWSSNFDLENNVVNLTYKNCIFEPISVKSKEDIKHVNAYFKHKITQRELKDQGDWGHYQGCSSEVIRAQYSLPPNVISYLNRSFTKNALKALEEKSNVRTKRVNHQIRSETSLDETIILEINQEFKKVPGYSGYKLPGYRTQETILEVETNRNFVMVEKKSVKNTVSEDQNSLLLPQNHIQFQVVKNNEVHHEIKTPISNNGQNPLKIESDIDFDGQQFHFESNPSSYIEEIE